MNEEKEFEQDLKPCPFCGYEYVGVKLRRESDLYAVWCFRCGCYGPDEEDDKEAASKWNERK